MKDILAFSGFRKLAMKYASFGIKEMTRSIFTSLQVKQVQKYIQEITSADVENGPAGVRAQAMGKDGKNPLCAFEDKKVKKPHLHNEVS